MIFMLHFAVCDDEPFWIEKIAGYFASREDVDISLSCHNSGDALIDAFQNDGVHYDAVFLDMEMLGKNGLETAKILREMGNEVVIVFVTSYGEYAIAGYEVEAFRYLLKPSLDEKLPCIVTALVEKLARQRTTIVVKTKRGEIIIDPQEILFCEKTGHYIVVHTENAIHKTRMSMADFEKMLHSDFFVRSHNGFLVNLSQVRTLTEKKVILQRAALEIPIGRGFKAMLRKAWTQYLQKEAGL